MSVMYSMIAFVASAVKGHHDVSYAKRSGSAVDRTFGTFNSFGTIMFAFGGQIVMPEIQVCHPFCCCKPWLLSDCPCTAWSTQSINSSYPASFTEELSSCNVLCLYSMALLCCIPVINIFAGSWLAPTWKNRRLCSTVGSFTSCAALNAGDE